MIKTIPDPDLIKALLSNVFEGLEAPVIINIGFLELDQMEQVGVNIVSVVRVLREAGIDAVPFFVPEAKDPAKTVVSCTGLQTPFVSPKEAKKTAARLLQVLEKNGVACNMPFPVTAAQLHAPGVSRTSKSEAFRVLSKTLLAEAQEASCDNNVDELSQIQRELGSPSIFRGGPLGAHPYAVLPAQESKAVAYASKEALNAVIFATGTLPNPFFSNDELKRYGFLYEYEAAPDQKHYADWDLEGMAARFFHDNPKADITPQKIFETPLFPHRNRLKHIYLSLGEYRVYQIPLHDPRWQAFLKGHFVRDTGVFGFLAERRLAHLKEVLHRPCHQPRVHSLLNTTALTPGTFHDQSHRDSLEFFQGVYGKNALVRDATGSLVWTYLKAGNLSQPLMWEGWDLRLIGIEKHPKGCCVIDYDTYWEEVNHPESETPVARLEPLSRHLQQAIQKMQIEEETKIFREGKMISATNILPLDVIKQKISAKAKQATVMMQQQKTRA